jgi:hypothetical protein
MEVTVVGTIAGVSLVSMVEVTIQGYMDIAPFTERTAKGISCKAGRTALPKEASTLLSLPYPDILLGGLACLYPAIGVEKGYIQTCVYLGSEAIVPLDALRKTAPKRIADRGSL